MTNKNENQTELHSPRHLSRVLRTTFQQRVSFTCWRNKRAVARYLVLTAFLLLPIVANASPVIFAGGASMSRADLGGTTNMLLLLAEPLVFNVPSDTTAITTFNIGVMGLPNSTAPNIYNLLITNGPNFTQPSPLSTLQDAFQFTAIGDQTGLTFTVTQTGAQNITLHGVNYFITFALSQNSVLPGQTATISATLTPTSPVPEPTTILLLGIGLTPIVIKVRKRRKGVSKL